MKKAIFQADPNKGFIASFITPVSTKAASPFTMFDAALMAFRGRLLAMQEGGGSIFRTATVRKYTRG